MSDSIFIGVDAGTSLIKSVAFDAEGNQLAACSRENEYVTGSGGAVEQNMRQTWAKTVQTLSELASLIPNLSSRIQALSVTGQGDGTWLVDAAGEPIHDAWLWLDARSAVQAQSIVQSPNYAQLFELTGTGVNVCQMRTQLRWLKENSPELLQQAATSFHCKDYLYCCLTGVRATDPSEGVFTFGDYRTRQYSDSVINTLELDDYAHLLPDIVDGVSTVHQLSPSAAEQTQLPVGLPVCLGYVDVICTAIGGGILDASIAPGMTILGSTGMHMRYCKSAEEVQLSADKTGYTMTIPDGGYAQMQSNMAATLNIDWMLDMALGVMAASGVNKSRGDLLASMDEHVLAAKPASALFHPYISTAGERGPFVNPNARANFFGLDQTLGYFDLMRSVYEGLAFAARDCYTSMGSIPEEIRVSGGAANSKTMLQILASVLDRNVRVVSNAEAGATGAVMIAAVQQGLYSSLASCAEEWVNPHFGPAIQPDPDLVNIYNQFFPHYVQVREKLNQSWIDVNAIKPM